MSCICQGHQPQWERPPFSFSGKHTVLSQGVGKENGGPLPLSWTLLIATPASQKGSKSTFLIDIHWAYGRARNISPSCIHQAALEFLYWHERGEIFIFALNQGRLLMQLLTSFSVGYKPILQMVNGSIQKLRVYWADWTGFRGLTITEI